MRVMTMVTRRWHTRAEGTWVADGAATVRRLCNPPTNGMTTAVITYHLVDSIDGASAACIADNALAATVVGLRRGRAHEGCSAKESKGGEDRFHGVSESQWDS
jgi:hypothetical protein